MRKVASLCAIVSILCFTAACTKNASSQAPATVTVTAGASLIPALVISSPPPSLVGYHNMLTLAAGLEEVVNQRLADPTSTYYRTGVTVTDVVCVVDPQQANDAECVANFSDGTSGSDTAVVSADGNTFVTK
jgi:hypothetical protein